MTIHLIDEAISVADHVILQIAIATVFDNNQQIAYPSNLKKKQAKNH